MKLFKKLAMVTMALILSLGAGAMITSCGGDTDNTSTNSSVEQTTEGYTFIVLNVDGSAAANVNVQLCTLNPDGSLGACFMPVATDANGKAIYSAVPGAGEYEIHLFDASMVNALEFTGDTTTPAAYSEITLTLK